MNDVYNDCQLNYYYGEDLIITNYYLNPKTHRLTFDYEIAIYYYDIIDSYAYEDNTIIPVIKGKVDVVLKTTPFYINNNCG